MFDGSHYPVEENIEKTRAMVEYAKQRAREAGYKRMFIHARLTAIHFYEKIGFHQEGDIFEEQGLTFAKMVIDL